MLGIGFFLVLESSCDYLYVWMTGGGTTKVLIVTDSAALPTGLAETTRLIFGGLLAQYPDKYLVQQIGLFHTYAVTEPGWRIHATKTMRDRTGRISFVPEDKYGQQTFPRITAEFKPDVVFGFGDPQRLVHLCIPASGRKHKLVLHVNFDGLPLPPNYGSFLNNADLIITKSEFSKDVIAHSIPDATPSKFHYMYSPADIDRFAPLEPTARQGLREELLPSWMPRNAFVLGWVGRNQWRKQIWLLYKLVHYLRSGAYLVCRDCARVTLYDWDPSRQMHLNQVPTTLESVPGFAYDRCIHCGSTSVDKAAPLNDVFLWFHMPPEPEEEWAPIALESQFGLKRDRDIYYTPDHALNAALAPDAIPALYQIWDGLLFLSGGEGFGLPAWEAMCSALPVIYSNYSAHGEFLTRANAGIPVGGVLQPEGKNCIWRMISDIPQAILAVRSLYFDRTLGGRLGANGRAFTSRFARSLQTSRWHDLFQRCLAGTLR